MFFSRQNLDKMNKRKITDTFVKNITNYAQILLIKSKGHTLELTVLPQLKVMAVTFLY